MNRLLLSLVGAALSRPGRVRPFATFLIGFAAPLAAVLVPGPAAADVAGAVHVPFIEDRPFADVIKKARAEKKPIMLDVVASWCGPCKYMDKTTFSDAAIVDWSRKTLVSARVDAEKGEGRKIATRYAVRSFPTILFLDSSGNEIDRLAGALPA
ncbi:MAG: thioredoxin fold domain-containing protein, partial [Thermoanaerobaculia bacterium]